MITALDLFVFYHKRIGLFRIAKVAIKPCKVGLRWESDSLSMGTVDEVESDRGGKVLCGDNDIKELAVSDPPLVFYCCSHSPLRTNSVKVKGMQWLTGLKLIGPCHCFGPFMV
ncbi:hypothetical protein Tco_0741212 [Tanacetum coccineum]